MFPKQQGYDWAVGLYYVIVISLFPLTLRFSKRKKKPLTYRNGGGEVLRDAGSLRAISAGLHNHCRGVARFYHVPAPC